MLTKLAVSNLAVVERAEVVFGAGLNVLTGETGAGKSVLMGALDLVLGGRADASVVRGGAKEAEVEATFDDRTVRRTVTRDGRSRAWIDDESVTIAELRAFAAGLVDIHGARANQRLLDEAFQRDSLDAYGAVDLSAKDAAARGSAKGAGPDAGSYRAAWSVLAAAEARLAEVESAAGSEDELDLLRYQVQELEEASVTAADDDLTERHAAAAHAAEIVAAANEVTDALGGVGGVEELLSRLRPKLAKMAKHYPSAAAWSEAAEDLVVRVQELSRSVADEASKIDADPDSFERLDARLAVVTRMRRKYGDPVAALAKKRARLDAVEGFGENLEKARAEVDTAKREVAARGASVTKRRKAVADKFAKAVTRELKDLGFARALFSVAVEPADPGPSGCDRIVYRFAPNPGEPARPLAEIASSGEIARVMLALKALAGGGERGLVQVFDEIDANVGGATAAAVGRKLREVARHHQVVAITHLPQSAVFGERHFVVEKEVSEGRTRTHITEVAGEARVSEVARMLGGEEITSVVRKHAQELLKLPR